MLATTYTVLFVCALAWLGLLLARVLPGTIGGMLSLVLWLALIPSSFAVQIGAESGSLTAVQQPTLAFVAVAGFVVSGIFMFADVTGRVSAPDSTEVGL